MIISQGHYRLSAWCQGRRHRSSGRHLTWIQNSRDGLVWIVCNPVLYMNNCGLLSLYVTRLLPIFACQYTFTCNWLFIELYHCILTISFAHLCFWQIIKLYQWYDINVCNWTFINLCHNTCTNLCHIPIIKIC